MYITSIVLALGSLSSLSLAAPTPTNEERSLVSLLSGVVSGISSDFSAGNYASLLSLLEAQTATATPTAVSQCIATMSSMHAATPSPNLFEYGAQLIANGLVATDVKTLVSIVEQTLTGEGSDTNSNTRNPKTSIYPKKASTDAPYTLTAAALRAAIYIPSGFTYGTKPPVILFPGTGSTGYLTFQGNFIPLLQAGGVYDPVWVNVPDFLLDDAQVNAEYAAYAINYIAGITSKNVSVIAWSQGNIDCQWAYKYWPSTRKVTSDHIAISPDYAGTDLANLICSQGTPCPPSVLQQNYLSSSNFITTLRANGGDSAYVPTTTLYSGLFDEIVEPQQGTGASAYLLDARGVGVTNNEVQLICPGLPAGGFYTHESMLANPITYALALDALSHAGPGKTSRLDLTTLCNEYIASGLDLADFLLTENTIPIALLAIILYPSKVTTDPAIMSYAA